MTDATRFSAALADRYHLDREIGQGGMATVYLAQDLKHDRRVAIKVLRPELAAVIGAERFLSEIKTTANLQHPHILPLHDSGEADSFLFYVMPFIEGESLRDRLNREKQLPIGDAVRIATEVAGALDYAHRHGVIHRDIKPENILLHDGRALVADFGIALAASKAGGSRMTETGMSLGTPHYMSPEQAMGEREITARSDVYALGCVTYEMLTGDPPFTGSTAQAIVARVVTESPRPLTAQRHTIPPEVEAAVLTALEKLPADRFATAQEFADALQGKRGTQTRSARGLTAPAAVGWQARLRDPMVLVPMLVAVAALAGVIALGRRKEAATLPPIRFILAATDSTRPFDNFPWPAAISPDGGTVVYSVAKNPTTTMLYQLRTDQLEGHPIPGTTNAYQPYFSPDGRWLAFEMDGKERKTRLDGSAPVTIADAGSANGADWTASDEIVLGSQGGFHGISHVSAGGGQPVALTQPDTAKGEHDHVWPIGLPDSKLIVFAIWSGSLASSHLAITSLDDGKVVPLGISGIRPLAVLEGMLIYVQADGAVMAVALNARRRRIEGRPIPVHDPVPVGAIFNGNSGIFVSNGGALVTSLGASRGRLAWMSRDGRTEPVSRLARTFASLSLSPDERRIAVVVSEDQNSDVWIYDLALGTFSRLTSVGTVRSAEWSPDGSRIVFTAAGDGASSAVWWQLASGGTPAEKLFQQAVLMNRATMSPDGKWLLVTAIPEDVWKVFRVSLDSGRTAQSYLKSKGNEHAPQFAPGGKWVALTTDESGQDQVYVRSFPDPSAKIQISVAGGSEPVWSRDGSRLYYRSGSQLFAARVSLSPSFQLLGRDTTLSSAGFVGGYFSASYQPTRDGRRIIANLSDRQDFQLVVSPNWITELRRRVAESRGERR
jgi:eukaryotic-like serine/threonine-protein kinase